MPNTSWATKSLPGMNGNTGDPSHSPGIPAAAPSSPQHDETTAQDTALGTAPTALHQDTSSNTTDTINSQGEASFRPEPAPVPISESDNPDAIALRSAISVLQIQRQRALNDIRSLEKLKHQVNERPEEFVKQLEKDNLSKSDGDVLGLPATKRVKTEDTQEAVNGEKEAPFEKIPAAQNIVRMPHVNWAKYHVVGEPLERMHEEQRRRPDPGVPRQFGRPPEHNVAAPYRPLKETLDSRKQSVEEEPPMPPPKPPRPVGRPPKKTAGRGRRGSRAKR